MHVAKTRSEKSARKDENKFESALKHTVETLNWHGVIRIFSCGKFCLIQNFTYIYIYIFKYENEKQIHFLRF